jgi:aminoglycoside phosphotransferase (APT) family kinase protein
MSTETEGYSTSPFLAAHRVLIDLGMPPRAHIASGMEGHVFAVGDDRIAKVWHARPAADLALLVSFYEMVHGLALPFATPVIEAIYQTPAAAVSIERALPGTPMSEVVAGGAETLPPFALDAVMSVLAALHDHPVHDVRSSLPMLGILPSDGAVSQGPMAMLLEVADRKVDRYGDHLRRSVRDFDEVYARMIGQLRQMHGSAMHAVHGDLCPSNILLGPDRMVSAVIDWGFLSHVGDPTFDASIACGTYDMYGPFARQHDEALLSECVCRHGYDRHRLMVHRALYAILTANAYSDEGTDGHYAWCVATLNRAEIRDALSA